MLRDGKERKNSSTDKREYKMKENNRTSRFEPRTSRSSVIRSTTKLVLLVFLLFSWLLSNLLFFTSFFSFWQLFYPFLSFSYPFFTFSLLSLSFPFLFAFFFLIILFLSSSFQFFQFVYLKIFLEILTIFLIISNRP
jgi:hypothetical protein